jgi:hypothetical protein
MKILIPQKGVSRQLVLLSLTTTLLGSLAAVGAPVTLVNEAFDPPSIDLFGWNHNASDCSWQYVNDGVAGHRDL